MIDWSGYITLILRGAVVTIELTLMGSVLALIFAFLAGLGRLSRFAVVRAVATVYVDGACVMRDDRPTRVDYDGALAELQAVQDFAVRRLQANDPRGRTPPNDFWRRL